MAGGERYQLEQVVNLLRHRSSDRECQDGAQACKEAETGEQVYFRCREEYGGTQVDRVKRLKELEQENAKVKRLVAELSLDKLVLKDITSQNSKPGATVFQKSSSSKENSRATIRCAGSRPNVGCRHNRSWDGRRLHCTRSCRSGT